MNEPERVFVDLKAHDVEHAALVGIARQRAALAQGRRPILPGGGLWAAHVTGALGELAVAHALGVAWQPDIGGNDHGRGDVCGYQVRATARPDGPLVIRDRDAARDVFVLVTGEPPRLELRGWLYGAEACEIGVRRAPNGGPPALFVAGTDLHPWAERPFLELTKGATR